MFIINHECTCRTIGVHYICTFVNSRISQTDFSMNAFVMTVRIFIIATGRQIQINNALYAKRGKKTRFTEFVIVFVTCTSHTP